MNANAPIRADGRTYHLETRLGDIEAHCLLVGSPERAEMIADKFFRHKGLIGNHRGLKSYTGSVNNIPMSVVTTGMGSASTAIVLPEAVYCGAKRLIRVGSCSTLWPDPKPGDSAICTGAVRFDGASENWAPIEFPAVADFRVINALVDAAEGLNYPHFVGIGCTTTCFNEGQGRPDLSGYLSPRLQAVHDELIQRGVLFYSMEEATIFVWALTHGQNIWAGAVDAIYGNRITNQLEVTGDEAAAEIALKALVLLSERYPIPE